MSDVTDADREWMCPECRRTLTFPAFRTAAACVGAPGPDGKPTHEWTWCIRMEVPGLCGLCPRAEGCGIGKCTLGSVAQYRFAQEAAQ